MGTLNLNCFLPGSIAVIVEVETRTRSETVNALETWKAPSRDACQEQEKSTKLKKKIRKFREKLFGVSLPGSSLGMGFIGLAPPKEDFR